MGMTDPEYWRPFTYDDLSRRAPKLARRIDIALADELQVTTDTLERDEFKRCIADAILSRLRDGELHNLKGLTPRQAIVLGARLLQLAAEHSVETESLRGATGEQTGAARRLEGISHGVGYVIISEQCTVPKHPERAYELTVVHRIIDRHTGSEPEVSTIGGVTFHEGATLGFMALDDFLALQPEVNRTWASLGQGAIDTSVLN